MTRHAAPRTFGRSGFTFIEVLFAVMILGIGFILIAGVFPVAIQQVESNADDTTAAMAGRGALASLAAAMPWSEMNPTDGALLSVKQVSPATWKRVAGDLVYGGDPRYACLPFVKYDGPQKPAQLTVLVVRNREGRAYTQADLSNPDASSDAPAKLEPRAVTISLTAAANGGPATDVVEFEDSPAARAAVPGAFLIIGTDQATGTSNGRWYQLGNPIGGNGLKWELAPSSSLGGPDYEVFAARAFLVGRSPEGSDAYAGPAQDVTVYTTFVSPRH